MTLPNPTSPCVAIACGGTGGHLFPGLAVAGQLLRRGCRVTLLISPKDVDQQAVQNASGMEIVTLPAVGLSHGRRVEFLNGFIRSYRAATRQFRVNTPRAVLAMGGFTSAPPILAAKRFGARTFLHESNTIPGRANRWLSWLVDESFIGFSKAGPRLHGRKQTLTGTPVRPQFQPRDPGPSRAALGLDPYRPVLLVMGGSQGAAGINELILQSLPLLVQRRPDIQLVHLTGPTGADKVRKACDDLNVRAVVHPFFTAMDHALAAATVVVSRSGASSLAELAAMQTPSVLVPYPAATDDHQLHNARAFVESGAARLLEQKSATPELTAKLLIELIESSEQRELMKSALIKWHAPDAAERIADSILNAISRSAATPSLANTDAHPRAHPPESTPENLSVA